MSVYRPKGYRSCIIKLSIGGRELKFTGVSDKAASQTIERKIKWLVAIQTVCDPMPHELAEWVHQLPAKLPKLDKQLRSAGIIRGDSGNGRRALTELLYGVIETNDEFERLAKQYRRNGNTEADARRKAMALHPTLFKTKRVGWFQYLLADENHPEYVLLRTARARIVIEGCGFSFYDDLDPNRIGVWLKQQRASRVDFGAATSNHP